MKDFIYKFITYLYKIRYSVKSNIKISKGFFVNTKLRISANSQFISSKIVEDCRIILSGSSNILYCYANVSSTEIRIIGDNCVVSIEENCKIRQSVIVVQGYNCNITIGKGTTIGSAYMVCMGKNNSIIIGNGCMIADNVEIWATDSHGVIDSHNNLLNPSRPIEIGNHVWIGKQAVIMKGVTIGDNSVIGMRSIVTKNIETGTLNVGSPSRCIKRNINWDRDFITKYELL